MGPVQILVMGFDHPAFTGEVLAELNRLRAIGIVRLVDALVVTRQDDGTFETLDAPTAMAPGGGELAAALLGSPNSEESLVADADADRSRRSSWSLADSVPVGTTAAVALIEHTWAGPLRAAVHRVGGVALEESWLATDDLLLLERLMSLNQP